MCICTCVKVSVTMPEELIEAVRSHVDNRRFSQYVTDAVAKRHAHDSLGELIDDLIAQYGPIDEELLREAAMLWPDGEDVRR